MASGIHYYTRVGTWDSVQAQTLGKMIEDPRTGRVFQYCKVNASTGVNKVAHGTPLHRLNGATGTSIHHLTADISSAFRQHFAGVAMINTAKSTTQFANAKATSGYCWIMTRGALGAVSTSEIYADTAYALTSVTVLAGQGLVLYSSTKSHAKLTGVSHKSTNTKPWAGFAGSSDLHKSAMTLAVPLTKGWINAPAF